MISRNKKIKIKIKIKNNINNIIHIDISKMYNNDITNNITYTDLFIYNEIKKTDEAGEAQDIDIYSKYLKYENYDESYDKKYIEDRYKKIIKYRSQLLELNKLPLVKQRTPEWFELRKERLTASDLGDALANNNLKLAKKKAGITKDNTNYSIIPPLKWGTMFESMASRCYSQDRNDIEIYEFGLIADKKNDHFGASPDGINDLGIMIEIKCPYSRKIIDGKIPDKYFLQIQGQLAVCDLEECDYIECDFKTYSNREEYERDIKSNYNNCNKHHGIIAEYKNKSNEFEYIFSDPYLNANDTFENIYNKNKTALAALAAPVDLQFIKYTYWRLDKINVQRVIFEYDKWNNIVPKINQFWEKVEECKLLPIEEPELKQNTSGTNHKIAFIPDDDDDADDEANDIKKAEKEIVKKNKSVKKTVKIAKISYKFIEDDD